MPPHWTPLESGPPDGQAVGTDRMSRRGNGAAALSAILYLCFGFVCGAVFWHFIGFWNTFHDIVLRGPSRVAASEHRVAQSGPSCTALVLDRDSGVTRGEPCAASSLMLAESVSYRRDRLPDRRIATPHPLAVDTSWTVVIKEPPGAFSLDLPSIGPKGGLDQITPH